MFEFLPEKVPQHRITTQASKTANEELTIINEAHPQLRSQQTNGEDSNSQPCEPPYTQSPRYNMHCARQTANFDSLFHSLQERIILSQPMDSTETLEILNQLKSTFSDTINEVASLKQNLYQQQASQYQTEKKFQKSLMKVEKDLKEMLTYQEGNTANSFTGYNGAILVHPHLASKSSVSV